MDPTFSSIAQWLLFHAFTIVEIPILTLGIVVLLGALEDKMR